MENIVFIGLIVHLIGTTTTIRSVIRGKTKPNRVSWLLWGVSPLIGAFAAISSGVTYSAIPVFLSGIGPLLIIVASFYNPKSYWKLTPLDYFCGALSVVALVAWYLTQNPLVAVAFALTADIFASIPSLIKSYNYPDTENGFGYLTAGFSALTGIIAIQQHSVIELAFPIYLLVNCLLLTVFTFRRRIIKFLHSTRT